MRPVVLCFERRKQNLECEQRLLETAGYTVVPAGSPEEAVALAQAHDAAIALVSDDEVSDDEHSAHYWICASLRRLRPALKIVLQKAGLSEHGPSEADLIIPKATSPRAKLALLKQLELPKAS